MIIFKELPVYSEAVFLKLSKETGCPTQIAITGISAFKIRRF